MSVRGVLTNPTLRARLSVAATFPVAFGVHDLEEVLAAGHWQRTGEAVLRRRFPHAPQRVVDLAVPSARQMTIAIGVVGVGVLSATAAAMVDLAAAADLAVDGSSPETRPGGEMRVLRVALAAFTAHGVSHLATSIRLRSYTPGVLTVPLVIAPYSVWAWRRLLASGLRIDRRELARSAAAGAAVTIPLVLGAHALGRLLTRTR